MPDRFLGNDMKSLRQGSCICGDTSEASPSWPVTCCLPVVAAVIRMSPQSSVCLPVGIMRVRGALQRKQS